MSAIQLLNNFQSLEIANLPSLLFNICERESERADLGRIKVVESTFALEEHSGWDRIRKILILQKIRNAKMELLFFGIPQEGVVRRYRKGKIVRRQVEKLTELLLEHDNSEMF